MLRGFDFERWKPRLILLEDHVTSLDKHRFMKRCRLSPDAPHRPERLVCAAGRCAADGSARALADIPQILSGAAVPHVPRLRGGGCATASDFAERRVTMPRLSAIVIAKNEASNIAACLDSARILRRADRGRWWQRATTTAKLAEAKGARVTVAHGVAGLRAAEESCAVACERRLGAVGRCRRAVSEELAAEIRQAIAEGLADAYEMPRLSTFCGRPMRHSGWYPDYVLRLFRREPRALFRRSRA